jgi:hypothetical protein
MPPLEAKKLLFKMAAATWKSEEPDKIMHIDVKKAHSNGVVGEEVWACIELPAEDYEEGKCGRLRRWLYGMRPAAKAWEDDYAEKLESIGFCRGRAAPTVFYHPKWKVRVVVHGDDFTMIGKQVFLNKIEKAMREWYIITVKGTMGPKAEDCKDLCILNRRLRIEGEFLVYEPDPKHAKIMCTEMGLKDDSKGLDAPIAKDEALTARAESEEPLSPREATRFRGLAARANYIAQDRVDVQYAAKELCREMSSPVASSWSRLKRLARYLLEYPGAEWRYPMEEEFRAEVVEAYSDSDWAGCKVTRKSTSGGMLVIDGCCLRSWSSTQATVATSSGEAELYALVKASSEALGFKAVANDLGVMLHVVLFVDSSTAQSISSRSGIGRTKHVEVKYLWVQEVVRQCRVSVVRVAGTNNPADVLTKPHSAARLGEVVGWVGGRIVRRRCGTVCRVSWADMCDSDFESEFEDGVDVWRTVDPKRDSTEGGCWGNSTHPTPSLEFNLCLNHPKWGPVPAAPKDP